MYCRAVSGCLGWATMLLCSLVACVSSSWVSGEGMLAGAGACGVRDWVYLHGVTTPGFVTEGGEEFRFVDCASVVHRGLQGHPGLTWWDRAGWCGAALWDVGGQFRGAPWG